MKSSFGETISLATNDKGGFSCYGQTIKNNIPGEGYLEEEDGNIPEVIEEIIELLLSGLRDSVWVEANHCIVFRCFIVLNSRTSYIITRSFFWNHVYYGHIVLHFWILHNFRFFCWILHFRIPFSWKNVHYSHLMLHFWVLCKLVELIMSLFYRWFCFFSREILLISG